MEFSKKEKDLMKRVGEELRKLRKEAGYSSFEAFALDIDMDSGQYGCYERGENITTISLYRLLTHHELRLDQFYERVFQEHRTKDSKVIQMKTNNQ
jgi:transcriptional regulator with XRE-family HTH domain